MMIEILLSKTPVMPVIMIEELASAVPLAQTLVAGGLPVLEITLRTPIAWDAIARILQEVPAALVGAGTVRQPQDLVRLKALGATFAVSPGSSPDLLQAARDLDFPLLPGVMTPSEIMMAWEKGFHYLKFFPAVQAGGIAMLKAWQGPFPDVSFCPTGGITLETAPQFLALPNVVCVGGSWITPTTLVKQGAWNQIEDLARQAAQLPRKG